MFSTSPNSPASVRSSPSLLPARQKMRAALRLLVAALAFIWLSALAARIAHHWGGVPFESGTR